MFGTKFDKRTPTEAPARSRLPAWFFAGWLLLLLTTLLALQVARPALTGDSARGANGTPPSPSEEESLLCIFTGRVVGVGEGGNVVEVVPYDTPEAAINRGRADSYRIRLRGVGASQDAHQSASRSQIWKLARANQERVYVVATTGKEPGQLSGQIHFAGGSDVGKHLIRSGLARWDKTSAPRSESLEQAEAEARKNGRGLWSSW